MSKNNKVDYNYTNAPIFKKYGRFLPFVIYEIPENFIHHKEDEKYYNDKFVKTPQASLKVINEFDIKLYLGLFAFFSIFSPIYMSIGEHKTGITFNSITFLIGLIFLFLAYKKWKISKNLSNNMNYITFNRLTSLLTMPQMNHTDYFTIPFHHLKATRRAIVRSKFSYLGKELHFFNDTRPWRPWRGDNFLTLKYHDGVFNRWSFYVWYMDKNRPLPPLPVFDKYIEQDFERRKAEGFPPPLFKSLIPTPEATPQQQAVRDNFWKDEDYLATKKEAHFSLNPLDKHYKGMGGEINEKSFNE